MFSLCDHVVGDDSDCLLLSSGDNDANEQAQVPVTPWPRRQHSVLQLQQRQAPATGAAAALALEAPSAIGEAAAKPNTPKRVNTFNEGDEGCGGQPKATEGQQSLRAGQSSKYSKTILMS